MIFPFSFLIFLAFFTASGETRQALDEEFPFQVSIKSLDKRHLCGGAIITPKWILTISSCLEHQNSVFVGYGSADANNFIEIIPSERIILQQQLLSGKKNRLALIELKSLISFSNTASQAKLPTEKVKLQNTTKLSGWEVDKYVDIPPSLYVTDRYFLITENCKMSTGTPVHLNQDEFCGQDENFENKLTQPSSIVSKSAIVLGILPQQLLSPISPTIFVKISEHEQWIRETLGADAQRVNWVDKVPKDSANSQSAISLLLIGISALIVRNF